MSKTIADQAPESFVAAGAKRAQTGIDEWLRSVDLSTWERSTIWLIAAMTALRLVVTATTGLTDTESYYFAWSRFPDWSYYDHPPLVAWMVMATTLGSKSAFAVRLGPVVCSALFGGLLFRLTARLFSPRAGFIAVAIVTIVPAFFFTSFILNPESALAPLWVLYLIFLEDLKRGDEPVRPLLLGLVIGVAFLAKYTAILGIPLALVVVATSPSRRRWLARPSFYVGGIVALLVTSPVIYWNVVHHWPSISLHLSERMPPVTVFGLLSNARRAIISQIGIFHPLVWPGLIAMIFVATKRARSDERYRLLAWSSGPVLLFFLAIMARVCDAESHWTMVAYVPLAAAAGGWLDERLDGVASSTPWRWYARGAVTLSVAAMALIFIHAGTPALLRILPQSLYSANADPLNETLGWDEVATAVTDEARLLGPDTVVVSVHNVLCGHVATALGDRPAVYCASRRRTEFDFVGRRNPPARAPVVYVDTARYRDDPAVLLPGRRCSPAQNIDVARDGRTVNEFRILTCTPDRTALPGDQVRVSRR